MTAELENEVKLYLAQLLDEGVSLSNAQSEINHKYDLKLTYMDIRIMASALDVDWKKHDPHPPVTKDEEKVPETPDADEPADADTGKTVVEISKLMRPGTALSGTVKFASGPRADWYVDQTGRLGLENLSGGEPTPEDIQAFQLELRAALGAGQR